MTLQNAYVSRLYDVDGFDLKTLSADPAVFGASVSIRYTDKGTSFLFRDTLDNNNLNSRYNSQAKYSYLKSFRPDYNREIELNVILPNGQKLISKTKVPDKINFDEIKSTHIIIIPPRVAYNYDTVYIKGTSKNYLL